MAGIAAGGHHACARFVCGSVKCWGCNMCGQLGQGHIENLGDQPDEMGSFLLPIDLGADRSVLAIAPGLYHTCALFTDGSVKCWGQNQSGQLGLENRLQKGGLASEMGDRLPSVDLGTDKKAMAIATGAGHSCALLTDGTVKCWGSNLGGELGLGHTEILGDEPGEMGDNLRSVDLGSGMKATAIDIGESHTCVLLETEMMKCWGQNHHGQLGLGHTDSVGDRAGEMGDNLPLIDLGSGRTAKRISLGQYHTCALLDNGKVKCWGYNDDGQLGLGDTRDRGKSPEMLGDNLPVVDLGDGQIAKEISTGAHHTCALLASGGIKCWGSILGGGLGGGGLESIGDEPGEMGENLGLVDLGSARYALVISSGASFGCALLDDNTVKCWGDNRYGQLGLGHKENMCEDLNEMGDNLPAIDLGVVGLDVWCD